MNTKEALCNEEKREEKEGEATACRAVEPQCSLNGEGEKIYR
jgi:hypothetical protein